SIVMTDANGDELVDILVTNAGDDTASLILNRFDPDEVYVYSSLANDPDNDPVSYAILEAPGGMILDAHTGQIRWAPTSDQLGLNRVVVQAQDGRGGSATQEFMVHVESTRSNSAPVVTTMPVEVI